MGFSDEGGLLGHSDGPWKPFFFFLDGFRIMYLLSDAVYPVRSRLSVLRSVNVHGEECGLTVEKLFLPP